MIILLLTEFRVNRAINRRDIAKKTIFNVAAVRHIGFVVTSSYFIRVLCITCGPDNRRTVCAHFRTFLSARTEFLYAYDEFFFITSVVCSFHCLC